MKLLFFLSHPAKFHFHKNAIIRLRQIGHTVDIVITSKDILEDLIKETGWEYQNIFPKGRKINWLPMYISAVVSMLKTIYRMYRLIKNKRYDILIGTDACVVGKVLKIPWIYFTDDDIHTTPHQVPHFILSDYVVAPKLCDLGKYNYKRISYDGHKALAHLHPQYFIPSKKAIPKQLLGCKPTVFIRLSKYNSLHDTGGVSGIDDYVLTLIIDNLKGIANIVISSEREIPKEFEKYILMIKKNDVHHLLYYSSLFITDSMTMSAEAAVLGTPVVEYDDWWGQTPLLLDLVNNHRVVHGINPGDTKKLISSIGHAMSEARKEIYLGRARKLLSSSVDVSAFQFWLINNFPKSVKMYFNNPEIQYNSRLLKQ